MQYSIFHGIIILLINGIHRSINPMSKKKKKKDLVLASFAFDFLAQLKIFLMLCLDVMVGSREGIENVSRL